MNEFTVRKTHATALAVTFPGVSAGWEQWVLFSSDRHHDNQNCNQKLEKRHLDQALERNALIVDVGDLFCAMQGKWDRRKDQRQLRPELRSVDYIDALVEYCADFYEPYAKNWLHMSPGNHEGGVQKHHETDLTQRLAQELRSRWRIKHGESIPLTTGPYAGWIRFLFQINKTRRCSHTVYYTHGYGGGGPVTLDVIQSNRQAVFLGGVDMVVSGHTHDQWNVPRARMMLNNSGKPEVRDIEFVKLGSYQDDFLTGTGFSVERNGARGPKPLGAYWCRFFYGSDRIKYELIRAKD